MKKPSITKGPWHLNKDEIQVFKTSNVYAGDGVVMLGSSELKESAANGRLIAAAPAMAEALEAMRAFRREEPPRMDDHKAHTDYLLRGIAADDLMEAALTLAGYEF